MLVEIFYHIDEFCKAFEEAVKSKSISKNGKVCRERKQSLSLSEIVTICIYYHYSGYKNFKAYYLNYVKEYLKKDFKGLVSYNRFVELQKNTIPVLALFLQIYSRAAKNTGVSFIDSFSLAVCNNRRIHSHKTFKGLAKRGKTSMGWFYGFKIHFVINHFGEILSLYITPGDVSDNNENVLEKLTQRITGKLFGDKGYIIKKPLFEKLYENGVQIITKIRKNMKNKLIPMHDKLLLKKRGVIESIIRILKEVFNIEHSRHRSPTNFLSNIFSTLVAYCFKPEKPSISRSNKAITQSS